MVYLADSLVDLLARHIATFGTNGENQWLFVGDGEDPPHQNTVGYWWRKTLRDAGLAGTTLNTYAHLWPTAEDRTRKAAESIIAASRGGLPTETSPAGG